MHIYYDGKVFKLEKVRMDKKKIYGIHEGMRVWFYKKEVRILRLEVVS